ncbi:unnamed protein product [Brachionus calyciflorus]|uniref:Uncharacterized protein n=1 Tax=Brachionus calyciflorus TaxID=104777 RepID=A0A814S3Z7_9BILA|nr:unnamed protein product [Brachionus calyciflorus]
MNKTYLYIGAILVLNACMAVLIDCKAFEASSSSSSSSDEDTIETNKYETDDMFVHLPGKRPSWVVGRDLSDKNNYKRIIEFKKDLQDQLEFIEKYENDLDELKKLILKQKVNKRPSIYKPRGIGGMAPNQN